MISSKASFILSLFFFFFYMSISFYGILTFCIGYLLYYNHFIMNLKFFFHQSNEASQSKTFIRNKLAQVASLVFVNDFPQRWPQFFHDLMGRLASGPLAVDMYLRILLSVQLEVVDRDISHSPEVRLIH